MATTGETPQDQGPASAEVRQPQLSYAEMRWLAEQLGYGEPCAGMVFVDPAAVVAAFGGLEAIAVRMAADEQADS